MSVKEYLQKLIRGWLPKEANKIRAAIQTQKTPPSVVDRIGSDLFRPPSKLQASDLSGPPATEPEQPESEAPETGIHGIYALNQSPETWYGATRQDAW